MTTNATMTITASSVNITAIAAVADRDRPEECCEEPLFEGLSVTHLPFDRMNPARHDAQELAYDAVQVRQDGSHLELTDTTTPALIDIAYGANETTPAEVVTSATVISTR